MPPLTGTTDLDSLPALPGLKYDQPAREPGKEEDRGWHDDADRPDRAPQAVDQGEHEEGHREEIPPDGEGEAGDKPCGPAERPRLPRGAPEVVEAISTEHKLTLAGVRREFNVLRQRVAGPDGRTLLVATSGEIAISHHLYKEKMTYDPMRELAPVALVGIVPCVVVVADTTPVRSETSNAMATMVSESVAGMNQRWIASVNGQAIPSAIRPFATRLTILSPWPQL